jgi:hypothetical protein
MEPVTWQELFRWIIVILIGFAGAPMTQVLKNTFALQDKAAVAATAGVSLVIAVAEMLLSGAVGYQDMNLQSLPGVFIAVFGLASMYYGLLKGSESVFGRGGLLKERGKLLELKQP